MPISFLTTALLIVSVITNLTVEGIKKLLDGTKVKYSSNVLAAVLSVLIACAVSVIYLIMTDTVFTMKIGVEIVVLMYLGFLISKGQKLVKKFSNNMLNMEAVLTDAAGKELARLTKVFSADGKDISSTVVYGK